MFGGVLSAFYHQSQTHRPIFLKNEHQVIDYDDFSDFLVHDIRKVKIFNMTSNFDLANEIAYHLNTKVSKLRVYNDAPGNDSYIEILENIRSKHVYIMCCITHGQSVNEALINLFLAVSAAKRASAAKVVVILPYLPYSAQCDEKGIKKSVLMKSIIDMIEVSGADKVICVNNYNTNSNGFFSSNLLEIDANRLCVSHYKDYHFKDLVLVSMDEHSFPKLIGIRDGFEQTGVNSELGYIAKSSLEGQLEYVGAEVKGKQILLVDNIIDTGEEFTAAANYLSKKGAQVIYGFSVHGHFNKAVRKHIEGSALKEILITNTIPIDITNSCKKVTHISVGKMIAECIAQSCFNKTIKQLKQEGII
jgi:ribose-phosphate pyrophosphokinase